MTSIPCTNSKSLGFNITMHGNTPGGTHLFRNDVWAHAGLLQSPHVRMSDKVMVLTNILLPRHMYRYMATPSPACHAALEATYNFAVRLIAQTPRWVDPTPARTTLGIPSFLFIFNKMRMLHTLYTVRSPYARMGEIAMRSLFHHWMHGTRGNGSHTDQVLEFAESLDPDGAASAEARASAAPSTFMRMFIGDGFEVLDDSTRAKADAKAVAMSRLHRVHGRARADEAIKGLSNTDSVTMISLIVDAFPCTAPASVGDIGTKFGPCLCPFCGADIDVPSHAVACTRARALVVANIADPYNTYVIDNGMLTSPLQGIPVLGSDAILDVANAVATARSATSAYPSRMPFPGKRGEQRVIDITPIGVGISVDLALLQQGWHIVDPTNVATTVGKADCVFAATAIIMDIPPEAIPRWSAALRQSCASLLAAQPSIASGPDAHHFPLDSRRAERSNALHHAGRISDPNRGSGLSSVVVIGHLFGISIQVITVPRNGRRPTSVRVPNIAGAQLAGTIIIDVTTGHARAAMPMDALVQQLGHGLQTPQLQHEHRHQPPPRPRPSTRDQEAAAIRFWEGIKRLHSRPAVPPTANSPLKDFVPLLSPSREPTPRPPAGPGASAQTRQHQPPSRSQSGATAAPALARRTTTRNKKWALVPPQDIGINRSLSGSARVTTVPSNHLAPARTMSGSARVVFPPPPHE
jgi:hypothetical protein